MSGFFLLVMLNFGLISYLVMSAMSAFGYVKYRLCQLMSAFGSVKHQICQLANIVVAFPFSYSITSLIQYIK